MLGIRFNTGVIIGKGGFVSLPFEKIKGRKNIIVGANTTIGKYAWIEAINNYQDFLYQPKITIDENVTIGKYLCLTSINSIKIGRGCLLSEYVYISDHFHDFVPGKILLTEQALKSKGPVSIGENCFIGYRATILGGVSLGKNCVVGSHAVVTKSFPAYSMIGGVPAKLLKTYDFETKEWR